MLFSDLALPELQVSMVLSGDTENVKPVEATNIVQKEPNRDAEFESCLLGFSERL